jgi:hypothetical protein
MYRVWQRHPIANIRGDSTKLLIWAKNTASLGIPGLALGDALPFDAFAVADLTAVTSDQQPQHRKDTHK